MPNWLESQHPRSPGGSPIGGQFAGGPNWKATPNWGETAARGLVAAALKKAAAPAKDTRSSLPADVDQWAIQPAMPYQGVNNAALWKRVGIQAGLTKAKIPAGLMKDFGIVGLSEAKDVKIQHAMQASALGVVLDTMSKTNFKLVRQRGKFIHIGYGKSSDTGLMMVTGVGNGQGFFMVNTNFDLVGSLKEAIAGDAATKDSLSYPMMQGVIDFETNGNMVQAVNTAQILTAVHEIAHMTDFLANNALTDTWAAAMTATLQDEGKEPTWANAQLWLYQHVSGYAPEEIHEAMAEMAAMYMFTDGKDMPNKWFQKWGDIAIMGIGINAKTS
jgi:hypothetical protein